MGLFSNVLKGNSEPEKFSNEEAFTGLIIAITAADGDISEEEMGDLKSIVYKSRTLQSINGNDFTRIIDKVFRVLRRDGVQKLLSLSMEGLSSNLYEGTFALICDLAYSDGFIESDEERMLEQIQHQFGISEDKAVTIVEVISIKNQV